MIAARTPRTALVFVACLFGLGHAMADDSLATPPLTVGTSLVCLAANVGKSPSIVDIQLHDVNGTVVTGQRCTLPAGAVNAGGSQCSAVEAAPAGFVGYCTFTVIHGSKQDIRAAILSQNVNLGPGAQASALPAQ